jgi:hypothetical protein
VVVIFVGRCFQFQKRGLLTMNTRTSFTIAFIPVFMLMASFSAYALSVNQYESETKEQRADFVAGEIDKIVADVAKTNPALSKAIHDYFYVIPEGQPESPGLIAFGAELVVVHNLAEKGKLDLDKVQIEGILLEIIKLDVVPNQKSKDKQPQASK